MSIASELMGKLLTMEIEQREQEAFVREFLEKANDSSFHPDASAELSHVVTMLRQTIWQIEKAKKSLSHFTCLP